MTVSIKRSTKDSVFTTLFRDSAYVYELYKELHPEDTVTRQEDITNVTCTAHW